MKHVKFNTTTTTTTMDHLAEAAEYTDCISEKLPNQYPGYDTKKSDSEAPVMLELWGMRSVSLLPSLPGPLWPRVLASDRVPSMG